MSTQVIGNTGIAVGAKIIKKIVRGFLVQTFDDSGSRNVLDFTGGETTLTKITLDALIVNSDASKRWYPLPAFNDADLPKADTVVDTAADGTNFKVREGIRSFTSMFKEQDTSQLKALNTALCGGIADWSIFLVDECDLVVVEEVETNIGRPQKISQGTFEQLYHYANNTAVNDITINFDVDKFVRDEDLRPVSVDKDADILRVTGVVPVEITDISSITATGMTATMKFNTGFLGDRGKFTGAVAGDFELNAGAVTITTVVENPALSGIYDFVFPSTPATTITLTSSADGVVKKFEVIAKDFTTP